MQQRLRAPGICCTKRRLNRMNLTVQTAHTSNYPDPISFSPEDILITGRRDEEFPGWIWCQIANGNEGWAPLEFMRMTADNKAIAIQHYSAKELNTHKSETLETIQKLKAWILCRNQDGDEGRVPGKTLFQT